MPPSSSSFSSLGTRRSHPRYHPGGLSSPVAAILLPPHLRVQGFGVRHHSSSTTSRWAGKDLYQVLQVSHHATAAEIKAAYRKLALKLHPDRQRVTEQPMRPPPSGDPLHTSKDHHHHHHHASRSFHDIHEAYIILTNPRQRADYDRGRGWAHSGPHHSHSHSGVKRSAHPLYTSRPPPHWKFTWDHVEHHRMHYGDGLQQEAVQQALRSTRNQLPKYQSPLGKGFSFVPEDDPVQRRRRRRQDASSDDDDHDHAVNTNPYAKRSPQGPPRVVVEYEESSLGLDGTGRAYMARRQRIVEDLFQRRQARHEQQQQTEEQEETSSAPTPEERYHHSQAFAAAHKRSVVHNNHRQSDECTIL